MPSGKGRCSMRVARPSRCSISEPGPSPTCVTHILNATSCCDEPCRVSQRGWTLGYLCEFQVWYMFCLRYRFPVLSSVYQSVPLVLWQIAKLPKCTCWCYCCVVYISIGLCKRDVTTVRLQWSDVFIALTYRFKIWWWHLTYRCFVTTSAKYDVCFLGIYHF